MPIVHLFSEESLPINKQQRVFEIRLELLETEERTGSMCH